jgi:hypothetical protein
MHDVPSDLPVARVRLPGLTFGPDQVLYQETSKHIRIWRESIAERLIIPTVESVDFYQARQTFLQDQEAYLRHLAHVYPEEGFAQFVRVGNYQQAADAIHPHLQSAEAPSTSGITMIEASPPILGPVSPPTLKFPGPPSWTAELRESAVSILRESMPLLPYGKKFPSNVGHAVLLLCSKSCGVQFLDPLLENISLAYFQQLITEGIIAEPHWIRPGASRSRSRYKGWNDFLKAHTDRGIRAKYVPAGEDAPVFIYGLNAPGATYFHSAILKAGVCFDVLTANLQYCQSAIHLPASLAAELKILPDHVAYDQVLVAS